MDHTNCTAEHDLKQINFKIDKVISALLGDEYEPLGVIGKIKSIDARVTSLEDTKSKVKWIAIGFFLAGGGSGFGIGLAILKLFGA